MIHLIFMMYKAPQHSNRILDQNHAREMGVPNVGTPAVQARFRACKKGFACVGLAETPPKQKTVRYNQEALQH